MLLVNVGITVFVFKVRSFRNLICTQDQCKQILYKLWSSCTKSESIFTFLTANHFELKYIFKIQKNLGFCAKLVWSSDQGIIFKTFSLTIWDILVLYFKNSFKLERVLIRWYCNDTFSSRIQTFMPKCIDLNLC